MAEQATTHAGDPSHATDAAVGARRAQHAGEFGEFAAAVPQRRLRLDLGKSLRTLWDAARPQYVDAATDLCVPVPRWDDASGVRRRRRARARRAFDPRDRRGGHARQFGYASVDDYYAAASSDQRLGQIAAPLLLLNAFDDPIVPG